MYGYQDSGELAPGNQGGKFGLNTGVVTKFEFNPNAGKDGAAAEAIDLTVKVDDKEFRSRYFPVTKVFAKGGGEITDTNSKEYKDGHAAEMKQFNGVISDIVEAFVSKEDLKAALATPISSFKDFASIVTRLVQTTPNWDKKPVDVFLQYQWSPQGDNTRTFLELPKNVKHGSFVIASQGPGFEEVKTATSLKYVNTVGDEHPFKRGEWFLNNNFANPVVLAGSSTPAAGMPTGAVTGGSSW